MQQASAAPAAGSALDAAVSQIVEQHLAGRRAAHSAGEASAPHADAMQTTEVSKAVAALQVEVAALKAEVASTNAKLQGIEQLLQLQAVEARRRGNAVAGAANSRAGYYGLGILHDVVRESDGASANISMYNLQRLSAAEDLVLRWFEFFELQPYPDSAYPELYVDNYDTESAQQQYQQS